jgi:DHA2 family lincomycin resistance protein-like MFS transporter
MIGISMVWMPAQTNGLNQLPPELYPHGTAVINTLQQVAGAIGTAVAIIILTSGMEKYLHNSPAPTENTEVANAMMFGSQHVFLFTLVVTLIGLAMAFFIRRVVVNRATMNSMH